ncbi:FAD-dependent oxidoreductase [Actinomadura madurae]|uniref:FAD-dependent oxidoreductase n=1 Tax=Actinomadura madurae TaxID=1993 RepID=UPI002025D628|nr:FAD-binding protein [Actinomadura madurae]MCP9955783.1 FAD-dependent oxidoreductase [Actinomadura madurae]MCP9972519.1 FAD-dependent oxidoreductase [Actinomadura madurae]MCP9985016.1 FAD-dependent oxidoreductase [Actinomadura madurae]MCQ0003412.1 FAD-dependent oxidoreductase [Actinomadura madurae]URN01208.1 FAD-dependent oxidoreductase [Actinomadura madurae]
MTIVRPGDSRYAEVAGRVYNTRFVPSPDEIWLVRSATEVEQAVNQAVAGGRRITVRSGGHCFEGLVGDPQYRLLVDTSSMKGVTFDRRMNAFAVEAGARLGEVYRALYEGWGVTVPGGVCPEVGVGGHVSGGGYGPLSRRFGLIVDHLYAVEVVVAGRDGTARTIIATREPDDPNRDLWWAHTGGGGGGFGIVTRFWFRSPRAAGRPSALLPAPPSRMRTTLVSWPWAGLTEAGFTRLVTNHNAWHAANSSPGSPYSGLHSALRLYSSMVGVVQLDVRIDATLPNSDQLHDAYIAAVSAGVGVEPTTQSQVRDWLDYALEPTLGAPGYTRNKSMGLHLRDVLTENQIGALHRSLTDPNHVNIGMVYLASYGCAINTVAPSARAIVQRDSILKMWYSNTWSDPAMDEVEIEWVRTLRKNVHAATGGFPVPNAQQDGGYINYPDVDLRDPLQNRTGVPWYEIIWKDNHRRLQRAKNTHDPRNVFRHALSLDPA